MEHFLKNKFIECIVLSLIVFFCAFSSSTVAWAASAQPTSGLSFYTNEVSDDEYAEILADHSILENYEEDHVYYGSVAGWEQDVIDYLIDENIIRGVNHNGKLFLPSENYINGTDALGITIFYHWPSYNGNASDRNSVFSEASNNFIELTNNAYSGTFSTIASEKSMLRKEAALILATCIETKSNGEIALDNYSKNKIGLSVL